MRVWIARDKNGDVYAYTAKPHKEENGGIWDDMEHFYFPIHDLPKDICPEWEDGEPIEVELEITIKRI